MVVLGKLFALLAHDLRNPLSALHSNIGFLSSVVELPDGDVRDAIADGLISCDGLSHIIDNIDLLGQTLREARWAAPGPIAALPFVAEVVQRCDPVAQSHSLSLELSDELEGQDVEVFSNRELLARALSNLVRNSVQFSPSGSVVRVTVRAGAERLRVGVSDIGSLLPEDVRADVFTASGQLSSKSSNSGRYSRGMGLYSARLAADVAGAEVAVAEPEEGFQNTFQLDLPIYEPGQGSHN